MFICHILGKHATSKIGPMTAGLKRNYGSGYLHFITSSCYLRRPILRSSHARDLFLQTLEQVRISYHFIVVGYVVMPEHFHLLISKPERGTPSTVMQVLKQRFARKRSREFLNSGQPVIEHIWQHRFYDFVVCSAKKRSEKLRYMHHNPVKRGLVQNAEDWAWSSFRHYTYGERGLVLVDEQQPAQMKIRNDRFPPFENREGWGSL
jgi:putative transposase